MIVRVGDRVERGRAVDLVDWCPTLAPATVARAVREGRAEADGTPVAVQARQAGALHERVGCVTPAASLRPRTALAVAARSRGWSTPVDGALREARERLATVAAETATGPDPNGLTARRRLADADDEVARLRERVAEARGRVQARRDGGTGSADSDAALQDVVRDLSEVETAVAAAREKRRVARAEARAARDRLEDRLALEDDVGNLERQARAHLVERARAAYESALATVPDIDEPIAPFDAPPDAMALAVARVGDTAAPVVVACDRFADARAAARWLDAPAVRLEP